MLVNIIILLWSKVSGIAAELPSQSLDKFNFFCEVSGSSVTILAEFHWHTINIWKSTAVLSAYIDVYIFDFYNEINIQRICIKFCVKNGFNGEKTLDTRSDLESVEKSKSYENIDKI